MRLGLGIDAGGSATRWALMRAGGEVVARGEMGSVTGHLFVPEVRARFVAFVAALADAVPRRPDAVVAGITGLTGDAPEAAEAGALLGQAFGGAPVEVQDDLWIGYHAAFRQGEGIVVYAGTGSVGMHIRADGEIVRAGGRGILIDDAGSAFWIGRRGLDVLYRRVDAAEDVGALGRCLYAAVGDDSWNGVRAHVYGGGRSSVAMLALAVAEAAEEDAAALAILAEAGRELARLAVVLARRVGALPVALIGRAAGLHPIVVSEMRAAAGVPIAMAETDAALAAARVACGLGATEAG
jgi:N-acetylglucosamine kinase-like BadF-type ATPase